MTIRRLAAIMAADVASYSAIMESDEEGTLARLKCIQREVIQGKVLAHSGRIVKTMGDGFLAEFASPLEALKSALAIQGEVAAREQDISPHPISLRIAINLGDILVDDDGDIFGDDVNISARLQTLAEPGRIVVSGKVFEEVAGKLDCGFEDRGQQRMKNISRPVHVYAARPGQELRTTRVGGSQLRQEISFCRAPDGVRLAWAKVGHGPPLVKPGNWVGHLEDDWESPVWHHVLERLARRYTLIRHDSRGNGLSDWEVGDLSLEAWVSDLESVVDAAGVARFALLGISQGCAVSIAYAVRHPERVSHLVLYGGVAVGARKRSPDERERQIALNTLMRLEWGSNDPSFRQLFTSQLMPDATKDEFESFNERQRRSCSPECAARYYQAICDLDVRELLPKVSTPTLVLHVRDDRMAPVAAGRAMAAEIPGARFVVLPGRNHLFREGEPASERFFEEVTAFIG